MAEHSTVLLKKFVNKRRILDFKFKLSQGVSTLCDCSIEFRIGHAVYFCMEEDLLT